MTKSQLINEIAAQAGLTKTAAEKALDAMTTAMLKAFSAGDSVHLSALGTFKVVAREEHPGMNPRTGERITIAAYKKIRFTPSKKAKDAVNE